MAGASVDNDKLRRRVFNYICGNGGLVPFPVLLKAPSPLSKMTAGEIVAWLNKEIEEDHPFFLQYRSGKPGHIESVRLRLKIRLCLTYLRSRTCRFGDGCKNFHICKAFIEGNCKDSAQCCLSHSFHDSANVGKLNELGLGSLPDGTLKNIIANNLPQVCKAYTESSCQDRKCQSVHICDKFVQYHCLSSEKLPCDLSHDLKSDHNSFLLKKFGFAGKFSNDVFICHILLPKGKRMTAELGNPTGVSVSKENLNDLSEEKKMPGKFGLPVDEPKEKEAKGKRQRGQRKGDGVSKQGSSSEKEVEADPKMNIGEGYSLRGLVDWSGHRRGGHQQGRGRGAVGHDRGKGRGRWKEGRGSAPNNIDREAIRQRILKQMKMRESEVAMPEKLQVDPGEKGVEKSEDPGKKHQDGKKREKWKKGKKVQQAGSEEIPQESFDLIDLSEEPDQSQSMSLVDLSIDEMLSMDDAEKQIRPLPNADDALDDWLGSLSSQTSSQGSTLDLFAELSEENTQASAVRGPNERAVVRSICKEYNGTVAFPVLAKRQDLFPCITQEAEKWLRSRPRRFLLLENEHGGIEEVSVISLGARLCFLHQMKKGNCSKPNCYFFHLCKEYVICGNCSFGTSCRLCHNFHSKHNQPLLKKLGVADFTDIQLRNLVIASGPQVCLDYNEFDCNKGLQCNKIHVCKNFIKNKCSGEGDCDLAHELGLSTSHTKHVLAKFHLQNVPPKGVYRMLMVCEDDGEAVDDVQKELQLTGEEDVLLLGLRSDFLEGLPPLLV